MGLMEFLKGIASDLAADATSITWDAPGGVFDRLHGAIERSTHLSEKSRNGCLALIAGASATRSAFKQYIGSGPIGNAVSGVVGSTVRQLGRRVLNSQSGIRLVTSSTPTASPALRGTAVLFQLESAVRSKLMEQFRSLNQEQQRLFQKYAKRCTGEELKAVAEMPLEDLGTMLEFLNQPTIVQNATRSLRVAAKNADQKMESLADYLLPWFAERKKS